MIKLPFTGSLWSLMAFREGQSNWFFFSTMNHSSIIDLYNTKLLFFYFFYFEKLLNWSDFYNVKLIVKLISFTILASCTWYWPHSIRTCRCDVIQLFENYFIFVIKLKHFDSPSRNWPKLANIWKISLLSNVLVGLIWQLVVLPIFIFVQFSAKFLFVFIVRCL